MAQLRKWGNRSLELDLVTYIDDLKTTGGPVFLLAEFWHSSSVLLLATKNSNDLSGQIESSGKKRSFAFEILRDQTIIQGVLVIKTNNLYIFCI